MEIARKLCAGLAAAHARGVLHRDLKPSNIMIDGHGEVRRAWTSVSPAVADQLDAADVGSGTPAYMASEQLAGREATATKRSCTRLVSSSMKCLRGDQHSKQGTFKELSAPA